MFDILKMVSIFASTRQHKNNIRQVWSNLVL